MSSRSDSNSVFCAVGSTLTADESHIGTSVADPNDYVIYDDATGKLFYDADGNDSDAQVQFASLATGRAMTSADFAVS